jgi:hypothetical protein
MGFTYEDSTLTANGEYFIVTGNQTHYNKVVNDLRDLPNQRMFRYVADLHIDMTGQCWISFSYQLKEKSKPLVKEETVLTQSGIRIQETSSGLISLSYEFKETFSVWFKVKAFICSLFRKE